ncbi:MAG: ATP-binding protein [Bacteroidales bacterium]|jgi:two-component system, OmpR family, phosphate regulon sensor histidine kinase PhoR
MNKFIFRLIVFLTSIALLGIFITQLYWVREAYFLKEEQFDNSVRIALKGVANQMLNYELKMKRDLSGGAGQDTLPVLPDVRNINKGLLDFKINEEFSCMQVGQNYEYAIMDARNRSFIMGNYGKYTDELLNSRHQLPMTGFSDSEHLVLSVYFPVETSLIFKRMIYWLVLSVVFALLLILGFFYTIYFFYKQKRLSEMKSDFINNMTHEFKTPLSTISLASEMLMKDVIREDAGKSERYARIIFDENSRLQNHVDQILRVSALEKGRFKLKKKELDLNRLIKKIAENFELTLKERNGEIKMHYCARNFIVMADEEHLSNVIVNLLDNANKYSPEAPVIKIGTYNTDQSVVISVEDKGIGISPENQRMIFNNLYRVSTGNIYNVKGFGIGLFYVKTIVEAHGGRINLISELHKGSRFDVHLPFVIKSAQDDDIGKTKDSAG